MYSTPLQQQWQQKKQQQQTTAEGIKSVSLGAYPCRNCSKQKRFSSSRMTATAATAVGGGKRNLRKKRKTGATTTLMTCTLSWSSLKLHSGETSIEIQRQIRLCLPLLSRYVSAAAAADAAAADVAAFVSAGTGAPDAGELLAFLRLLFHAVQQERKLPLQKTAKK